LEYQGLFFLLGKGYRMDLFALTVGLECEVRN
jgi:hypothetical protein